MSEEASRSIDILAVLMTNHVHFGSLSTQRHFLARGFWRSSSAVHPQWRTFSQWVRGYLFREDSAQALLDEKAFLAAYVCRIESVHPARIKCAWQYPWSSAGSTQEKWHPIRLLLTGTIAYSDWNVSFLEIRVAMTYIGSSLWCNQVNRRRRWFCCKKCHLLMDVIWAKENPTSKNNK